MTMDPIEVVRTVEELWNANKLEELDRYFAPEFEAHVSVEGMPPGLATAKMVHGMAVAGFGKKRTEILDIFASGEKVCVRIRHSGTNTGTGAWWLFAPQPNDKTFSFEFISIYQVRDGKILDHWAVADMLTGAIQLGGLQRPSPPS